MPPIWAIAAMVVLGWNEFFTALRNPLWLVAGVVLFLFFKVNALVSKSRDHRPARVLAGPAAQSWVPWRATSPSLTS